ncbi:MAG: GspH/FimT family pseudopilin [Chitinivibrionales bacterium]|nr:GspH/FimT family pseudopilin [Chitinivibrionales bacterium]
MDFSIHRFFKARDNRGFSLLELILVIVIVGVFAAIAIPSYKMFVADARLNGATNQVVSEIVNARMAAISSKHEQKIEFDQNATVMRWSNENDDNDFKTDEQVKAVRLAADYRGVNFTEKKSLVFSSHGMLNNAASITLAHDNKSKTIVVSLLGKVAVGQPGGAPPETQSGDGKPSVEPGAGTPPPPSGSGTPGGGKPGKSK